MTRLPSMPRPRRVPILLCVLAVSVTAGGAAVGRSARSLAPDPSAAPFATHGPCQHPLQREIDSADPGAILDLTGCTYLTGAEIDKPLTLIGASVRTPAGQTALTVTANDVTIDRVTLVGVQASRFAAGEVGILARGTTAEPIERLTIRDSDIATFGGYGAYLRHVTDLQVERNKVRDIVYAGMMVLSGVGGSIHDNIIQRIGLEGASANEDNAYGIAVSLAPGEPPSSDLTVARNFVEDVPTWHALDTHGGIRIDFVGNTIRRSMRAIFVTTDAAGTQPTDIAVEDNLLLSPWPVTANVAAVTTYRAHDVSIKRNLAIGWGDDNFYRDFEESSTLVTVADNVVIP